MARQLHVVNKELAVAYEQLDKIDIHGGFNPAVEGAGVPIAGWCRAKLRVRGPSSIIGQFDLAWGTVTAQSNLYNRSANSELQHF